MIRNDQSGGKSLKEIREKEHKEKEDLLRKRCNEIAEERYGKEAVVKMSNNNRGLWFLPVMNEDDQIEKLALMKPIDRHILSYASTKITDEGLYAFLEAAMRECFVEGDREILDEDEYFIPAANSFNKILEGKKASLLKR